MRIRWQDNAINDLIQVRRFIAIDNPSATARVADRIRSAVPELADQPATGRPGRVPGTRERVLVDVPYIIAYRVDRACGCTQMASFGHTYLPNRGPQTPLFAAPPLAREFEARVAVAGKTWGLGGQPLQAPTSTR